MPMMFLVPNPNLSPAERQNLGGLIESWRDAEEAANRAPFVDPLPLFDLLEGEPPQPLALRNTVGPLELSAEAQELINHNADNLNQLTPEELESIEFQHRSPEPGALQASRTELGEAATLRGIRIALDDFTQPLTHEQLQESLRHFIPADFIWELAPM